MLDNLCSEVLKDLESFGKVETRKQKNKREKKVVEKVVKQAAKTGKLDPTVRVYWFSQRETLAGEDINGNPVKTVSYRGSSSVQWGTEEGKLNK